MLIRSTLLALVTFATAGTLGGQTAEPAQHDSVKAALVHQLLTMTHAVDQSMAAMEAAVPAQKAANPRIPAIFWDRFLTRARARRNELAELVASVYERHFSSDELRQLVAFYETPTGQKILLTLPTVMQESVLAGQTWGRRIGAAIGAELEAEGIHITP